MHTSFSDATTLKFLCSYGGKILPRYPDRKLRYIGGQTRLLSVSCSISFSELLYKLSELCDSSVSHVRCQLPTEDLDTLVSITSDEDLLNLIEEYDRTSKSKIRAFLSFNKEISPLPSSTASLSKTSAGSSPQFPTLTRRRYRCCRIPKPAMVSVWNKKGEREVGCYCYRQCSAPNYYLIHNGKNHWH